MESESSSNSASRLMMPVYIVMITYIYGTFEKESQWGGCKVPSGHIYTIYTYIYVHIHIPDTYRREIQRRIRWDGLFGLPRPCSYIYLRKTSKVNVHVRVPCTVYLAPGQKRNTKRPLASLLPRPYHSLPSKPPRTIQHNHTVVCCSAVWCVGPLGAPALP